LSAPAKSLPGLDEVRAEKARRSLAAFVRYSWHVLEPSTPLVWNWHMDAIALHVQAALEDWMAAQRWLMREQERVEERPSEEPEPPFVQRLRDLLINVPPGSAKSRIISVCTPAWMWLHWPEWRAIFLSANPRVALRDSGYCRDLIESEWYQESFRPDWQIREDQNAIGLYRNSRGGFRQALGFLAKITGDRGDALFIDDPNDPEEAHSEPIRTGVNDRFTSTIYNRVNDLRTAVRIGIQQRVHEEDFSGHWLKTGRPEHVCIPMLYEPRRYGAETDGIPVETAIGWRDPRTEEGALLDPVRFPGDVVEYEKTRLGSFGFAGQHQQRPAPAGGGMLKDHWWRFWVPKGATLPNGQPYPPVPVKLEDGTIFHCPVVELPDDLEELAQSWDMAFKDTKHSAYVVGQVWARKLADRFLLDEVREKMDFPKTLKAVLDLTEAWPKASLKLVEEKANGAAIIQTLHSHVAGLVAVNPEGSKEARCAAVSPEIESGNVYLPHPMLYHWVYGFIGECGVFPNGTYKDRVDTLSQMLTRWGGPQPSISVGGAAAQPQTAQDRAKAILDRLKNGG
jgi:predicted phage terminase large subunit-like protein